MTPIVITLAAMAMDFTPRLVTVRFEDSAGTGMTIGPGDGNLSVGEQNAENAEHLAVYDRGAHAGFNKGVDLVQEMSITIRQLEETQTSAVAARVRDFMHKTGLFASASSVDSTIWAWKTILTYSNGSTETYPCCEGGYAMQHGFPSNTLNIGWRNHGAVVRA